ncbi:MAG: mechanosensitive ion channel family protein, partial [Flavobacterium sp.]
MKKKLLCFLTFFIVLFFQFAFAQSEDSQISKPDLKVKQYPVAPFKDTLFYVYNNVGSFSAENRAKAITEKIRKLYEDSFFEKDSISVVPSDISQDIIYKNDFVIMSILEVDAKAENQTVGFIAKRNLQLIKRAIIYQNENYSMLPKRLGYTALLILIIG